MSPPKSRGLRRVRSLILSMLAFGSFGCARITGPALAPPATPAPGYAEEGVASWYGEPFHGRTTASGETYDMEAMTAAHRSLPFGTVLWVENLDNGRTTTVRVNDRGPFVRGRHLDLSRRAARELAMLGPGTARVRISIVGASSGSVESCWIVQAGSFDERERAEELRQALVREGSAAEVSTGPTGVYRVRAGPYQSRTEAEGVSLAMGGMLLSCGV